MVDGSITRVHQHGIPKKTSQHDQAVGKSRGGLTAKNHASVDVFINPVHIILTTGQTSEYGQANALIEGFCANYILADKGYDLDTFIEVIRGS